MQRTPYAPIFFLLGRSLFFNKSKKEKVNKVFTLSNITLKIAYIIDYSLINCSSGAFDRRVDDLMI